MHLRSARMERRVQGGNVFANCVERARASSFILSRFSHRSRRVGGGGGCIMSTHVLIVMAAIVITSEVG